MYARACKMRCWGRGVSRSLFKVVLFGTLIETGAGLIQAFNERIDGVYRGRGREMPATMRPVIAAGLLLAGYLLSRVGLVELVGKGYNAMSIVFTVIVVAPLLTVGVYRLRGRAMAQPVPGEGRTNEHRSI